MSGGLAALRRLRFAPSTTAEFCELCSAPIGEQHDHLIDPRSRQLCCACQACAILFSSNAEMRYRRVPRDVRDLSRVGLSDRAWLSLGIPIGLAFLFRSSITGSVIAAYPSPAGPTETELDGETWDELVREMPVLARLSPDVEALLMNRLNGGRDCFAVPIDECYRLTGIVRKYWRGFSGGEEAWQQIRRYFDELKSRCAPVGADSYAEPVV